ncbi:WYL domain-containing protein [Ursidibacter maritimus]|uniref:WYL domain-containing protein n=2 Tax=Ursidibacter maritimus TaxID=1331689 RepID=A0A949T842_9PAST|nr:WYL domain-containing protein [Ursidibacter maritimus]KAE9542194.1 WYL domain-containing protein [Ursidibacter maritimus]MBV6524816.1 WYL domain-containing protein [Ursidibacter maritimus]MBV6526191.1 WYL domain-containing protein [Ursidibacter maritimus]MBV6528270.1 WYL domain-containing protein [Ursidibacter maritimus]MBV6529690.1 WYL domain-containing protein [Ursidibacter maritimus]
MKNFTGLQLQLEILRFIPKTRFITSDEILQKLKDLGIQRDLRSIQRQMQKLCEQFDIECDMRDRPYGYRWKPNTKGLDLPILNEQQSLVLMLAKQYLKGILPVSIMSSMDGFFQQAEYNLVYDSHKKSGAEWLDKVAIAPTSQPLLPAQIEHSIFREISIALYNNCLLEVHYRNQSGVEHYAEVKSLALVQQGAAQYLVVQYVDDKIRHLALHRFISAKATTFVFKRPDFNLKHYLAEQHFGFGDGKKIRFTFRIAKPSGFHLTETPLSADQSIIDEGETYLVKATVVESEMLNWWIAKFGDDLEEVSREVI